jgi:hypothetical protein
MQAISGVTPAAVRETTAMVVWPSNAEFAIGRVLGQLFEMRFPDIYFLRIGNLFALLSIPISLALYFYKVIPGMGNRYRLTNRRIIVESGLLGKEARSVGLDAFDTIELEVLPGQEWYAAGNLIFKRGQVETFRLDGVSRPDCFKNICWKAHRAYVGVKQAAPHLVSASA